MTVSEREQWSLPLTQDAPGGARRIVESLLPVLTWEEVADLRLGVSELVTNSVLHAGCGSDEVVELEITISGGEIRCEVSDSGRGFVVREPDEPDDATGGLGLGLAIVARLAARWGTRRDGRSVWFEIDRRPPS